MVEQFILNWQLNKCKKRASVTESRTLQRLSHAHHETKDLVCKHDRQFQINLATSYYQDKHKKHGVIMTLFFQAAGCNQVLGSKERLDRCGVCNGDGNSCKHVKDVYMKQWKELGN